MKQAIRILSLIIIISILTLTLTACEKKKEMPADEPKVIDSVNELETETSNSNIQELFSETIDLLAGTTVKDGSRILEPQTTEEEFTLSETQKNSINMLNYLVVFNQEIKESSNNRMFLENAYTELNDNIKPRSIDPRTQAEINEMFDRIEKYRLIAVKRERLKYVYEQNQAKAIRDAIPNPLGLLSSTNARSLGQLAVSLVYMAVDSVTSYQNSKNEAEMKYLNDGWSLDDEQAANLNELTKGIFNYMVDSCRTYKLPDELALNDSAVSNFAKWKNLKNQYQKIQLLTSNRATYSAFGPYWLELAKAYYEIAEYDNCLYAMKNYDDLGIQIFRKDAEYAQVLPLAIDAAEKVLEGQDYVSVVEKYADAIIKNTKVGDWALRYYAAQSYILLYQKTGDIQFLQKAYYTIVNNVTYLVLEQQELDEVYLNDVQLVKIPEGTPEEEEKEIKSYNDMLKEKRATELPPAYEPLLLNLDTLFALVDKLDISEKERKRLDEIIHSENEQLFGDRIIDDAYWFEKELEEYTIDPIEFDGTTFMVPVTMVSDISSIEAVFEHADKKQIVDDWTLEYVGRVDADYNKIYAVYYSENAGELDVEYGDGVTIKIHTHLETEKTIEFGFKAVKGKTWVVFNKVEYERVE